MKKGGKRRVRRKTREIIHDYRPKRRVIFLVSALIVIALFIFRTEYSLIRSVGAVALLVFFYLADHLFNLKFEKRHYIFIMLVAIINFPLGGLYLVFIHFDKFMHFLMPIVFAPIIFFTVSKLNIELKWRLLFTFFIVVGTLGIFEIGEYTFDTFFGFRLQGIYIYDASGGYSVGQSRIDDTMTDLVLGVLGTAVYVVGKGLFGKEKDLFKK